MKSELKIVTEEIEKTVIETVEKKTVTLELTPGEVAVLWTLGLHLKSGYRGVGIVGNNDVHALGDRGKQVMKNLMDELADKCPESVSEGWIDVFR